MWHVSFYNSCRKHHWCSCLFQSTILWPLSAPVNRPRKDGRVSCFLVLDPVLMVDCHVSWVQSLGHREDVPIDTDQLSLNWDR